MAPEDLSLPSILPGEMAEPSIRTMDEIDRWIEEDYALFFNREVYEEEKRRLSVGVPFRL